MAVKFSDHIIATGTHAARPVAADTPVAALYSCTDHLKIYRNTGAAWVDWFVGGTGSAGLMPVAVPHFLVGNTASGSASAADRALQIPIALTGPMRIRSLLVRFAGAGSGTHEWGLFDASTDATSAVKVAGGTGTSAGAGWKALAAVSAPVAVPAGGYILVFKYPAANAGNVQYTDMGDGADVPIIKYKETYTWDDTPDLMTGWTDAASVYHVALVGDVDGASSQW